MRIQYVNIDYYCLRDLRDLREVKKESFLRHLRDLREVQHIESHGKPSNRMYAHRCP